MMYLGAISMAFRKDDNMINIKHYHFLKNKYKVDKVQRNKRLHVLILKTTQAHLIHV